MRPEGFDFLFLDSSKWQEMVSTVSLSQPQVWLSGLSLSA